MRNGRMTAEPVIQAHASSGIRWVEQYFLPLIFGYFRKRVNEGLVCLQIEPDDEEEAIRMRAEGFVCDTVVCRKSRACDNQWQQSPILADPLRLPFESQSYDLVFSGAFSQTAPRSEQRRAYAKELARVCRKHGAVLLTLGNRRCPIDLSRRPPVLHLPWTRDMVSLHEMEKLFVGECGFSRLSRLSLAGHFSWNSLTGTKRLLAPILERYLRWSTMPDRPQRYASPFNPIFALWIER